jgi:hypothetical protein
MNEIITKKIKFQIIELRILSYFEKSLDELGLTKKEVTSGDILTKSQIVIYEKNKIFEFTLEAIFSIKKNNKRIELFGAKAVNTFFIENFKETVLKNKSGKIIKSNPLFVPLIECTLASMRGILVASQKDYNYREINLPYLDPYKYFDSIVFHKRQT